MAIKVLLDTHVLLWALVEPDKLSPAATEIIEESQNTVVVSAASAWEVAIKFQLGRLPEARMVIEGYHNHLQTLRTLELAINSQHTIKAGTLNATHRDPFDRILAAQCLVEGLTIITKDHAFIEFGVPTIW
ncbi:MAG: PIN domain nuclease [Sulfobacillus acidophilus]|uniref:PIN domain nuclease n=1 Tax=Sulfobacillus acidophilus TaxID=53633 RepID=A0A2T2WDF5_9FIRM|nr:MAG: PIN domain nuclease [Sulfobacillus acidophilus]